MEMKTPAVTSGVETYITQGVILSDEDKKNLENQELRRRLYEKAKELAPLREKLEQSEKKKIELQRTYDDKTRELQAAELVKKDEQLKLDQKKGEEATAESSTLRSAEKEIAACVLVTYS